jgi:hypothetical protein
LSLTANRGTTRAKPSDRRSAIPTIKKSSRTPGLSSIKLLVVVDATETSTRVLRYIGLVAAGCEGPELHLAYISPHPPPELLETGGSEVPERESRLGSNLRNKRRGWMAVADCKDWRVLRAAKSRCNGPASPCHAFPPMCHRRWTRERPWTRCCSWRENSGAGPWSSAIARTPGFAGSVGAIWPTNSCGGRRASPCGSSVEGQPRRHARTGPRSRVQHATGST